MAQVMRSSVILSLRLPGQVRGLPSQPDQQLFQGATKTFCYACSQPNQVEIVTAVTAKAASEHCTEISITTQRQARSTLKPTNICTSL